MTKEQLVLARVRTENGSISVCGDEMLSMKVQEKMLNQNWPMPEEIGMEHNMQAVEVENLQPVADEQDILLEAELEIIAQNKDIMCKIPQRTKLRFVKRVLNRILRLTNRYQQMFNQAVHEAIGTLAGTIRWLKPALRMTDEKANRALGRCDAIEENIAQMDKRLVQEIRRSQQLQEELQLLTEQLREAEEQVQKTEGCVQNMIQEVQEAKNCAQDSMQRVQKVGDSVQDTMQQIEKINIQNQKEHQHREIQDSVVRAVARDLIRAKWQVRDLKSEQKDESSRKLRCGICGYSAPEHTFEIKESDCIFSGGHLKRYVCPDCGCIFGPTKFADQSKQEFDDDYTVHYIGFQESDCTFKEKFAFEQLSPTKNGVYLNYGCGRWSHTLEELRAEGYQVYGYEPYAVDVDNPYIISDKKELSKMRFDGIFSNDLLEHLADPIRELQFMKLLLRTPESKMSHCTGCFRYKYEHTRFHMFFFTGNSVYILAEKAGLSILGNQDEPQSEDPCYVFGIQNNHIDLLHAMMSTDQGQSDDLVRAQGGATIYGPYLTLPAGEYTFAARLVLPPELDGVRCNITSEHGKNTLHSLMLYGGYNHICIDLKTVQIDLEIVIHNTAQQGDIFLEQLTLEPKTIDSNLN